MTTWFDSDPSSSENEPDMEIKVISTLWQSKMRYVSMT